MQAEERARALRAAIEQTHREHPNAVVPGLFELEAESFARWCVRTPDRWVDVSGLARNERGEVLVPGQTVAIWKYILSALVEMGVLS
jgi:hypothetical protein